MPIPKEILDVERPKNTVVIAYGKNKDHYAVRQRVGCKSVDGRHVPINGPTIGHIVDGKYIPMETDDENQALISASANIDLKDWANIILCDNLFRDIRDELRAVYNQEDTLKIYCIAILRVCNPGIKDYELKSAYEQSFLSELFKNVALSKNTVSKFLMDLGKTCSRITTFMKNRTAAVHMDHHLLVDGALKSDESKVNSLSDFSRKARTKGTRDISVLYTFDLEAMEPICSKCFPGNMLDVTSYEAFIAENGITKGIIVADKGFPSSAASKQFQANPDLHYLNPVKRNSKLIRTHNLLEFTDILNGYDGITYRKEKCTGVEKWCYAFRDSSRAALEEQTWLSKAQKQETYSLDELKKRQETFGTIVLECDLDLPADVVYKAYSSRWEIELVMRYYKSACEFDETKVHNDYSVIGSEFCDFLSTVLTSRLINTFDREHLLEQMTYNQLMSILQCASMVRVDGAEWQLVRTAPAHEKILRTLGLLSALDEPLKRKRGRPKKNPT